MPSELLEAERLTDQLTVEFLESAGVLPLTFVHNGRVLVATWLDSPDPRVLDDLRVLFNADIELIRQDELEVRRTIRRVYGEELPTAESLISNLDPTATNTEATPPIDDLRHQANEPPVVKLVNLLLLEALAARASDVHLEMYRRKLSVRYRVDGILRDAPAPPPDLASAIVNRLKIMAELDIAERRLPQDGRIRLHLERRDVDVRVSTIPTVHGESVVLRLLDKHTGVIRLDELGMAEDTLAQFRASIAHGHGIVLVTGPTGSGKTTTLYAALEELRTGREKILTVEDPVEYELDGVCQVPVNAKLGLTFATILRSLLRQDPDVILIGEIRDPETAEIAARSALTGHLVLATMHTNDAVGALGRLRDLSVPEYLIANVVRAVLAQRLVRRICTDCRAVNSAQPGSGVHNVTGKRCEGCDGARYVGRTGIYELLVVTEQIGDALTRRATDADLRRMAQATGMRTLHQDGARSVASGRTDSAEVLRVLG